MNKDIKQKIFAAQLAQKKARAKHDSLERQVKWVGLLMKIHLMGENRKQQQIMNLATRRDISNKDLLNMLKNYK